VARTGTSTGLILDVQDGDDSITVPAGHPYAAISVHGGNPSASDNVTLNGDGNSGVTAILGTATPTISGGGLGTVLLTGVEQLSLNNSGGSDNSISINGSASDDVFRVAPTGPATARVQVGSTSPVVFTNNSGALNVAGGGGGDDTLEVSLTSDAETVIVDAARVEVTIPAGARKRIDYSAVHINSLRVLSGGGADTFEVTPSAALPPLFVDGGDPIGGLPGDRLLVNAGGGGIVINAGPENDEGSITAGGFDPISFDHIEFVVVAGGGGPGAIINGTPGFDAITLVAQSDTVAYPPLAGFTPGVQDFTVTVNSGTEILFVDQPAITIQSHGGSDEITVRTPAPNGAVWDVDVTIDGGTPAAGGDKLIIETPGQDSVRFAPGATPDSGALLLDETPAGDNATDTHIAIQGVESLIYDGEAGNDTVTVDIAGAALFRPGTAPDAGVWFVASALPLQFVDLGAAGTLQASGSAGVDTLTYEGTNANETATLTAAELAETGRLAIAFTAIETVVVDVRDGDDTIAVTPSAGLSVQIHGGNPSASDTLTIATGGNAVTVSDNLVTSAAFGPVLFTGIERLTLGGGGNITLAGGAGDDVVQVVPTDRTARLNVGPLLQFPTSSSVVADGGTGGIDRVTVVGSASSDTIQISRGAATTVALAGLVVTAASTSVESLLVSAGAGDDAISLQGTGGPELTVDGGEPVASDVLTLISAAASAAFVVQPGATLGAGAVTMDGSLTQFLGIEQMMLNAGSLAGADALTVQGTGGDDAWTLTADRVVAGGTLQTSFAPPIQFLNFTGSTTSAVTLSGNGGTDVFTVQHDDGWAITRFQLDGGVGFSDHVLLRGDATVDETFAYTPTSTNGGNVSLTSGASTTLYTLAGTESLVLDAQGATGDALTVTAANANFLPGTPPGSGTVEVFAAAPSGTRQLGLGYSGFESTSISGTSILVEGTSSDDTVTISSAGVVTITNLLGFQNTIDVSGYDSVVLNLLGGDDTVINSADNSVFALTVVGGDQGSADRLIENGVRAATFDLAAGTLMGSRAGGGSFTTTLIGIETVTVNRQNSDVVTNALTVTNWGTTTDVRSVHLNAGDTGPADPDPVTIGLAAAVNLVHYTPESATAGRLDHLSGGPVLHVTGLNATPTVGQLTLLGGGNSDALVGVGTAGSDTLSARPGGMGGVVRLHDGALERLPLDLSGIESLELNGSQGSDVFQVTPLTGVSVRVDGGDPIGVLPGDVLTIDANAAAVVTQHAGAAGDTGSLIVGAHLPISFQRIESAVVSNLGAGAALNVVGTDATEDFQVTGTAIQGVSITIHAGTPVAYSGVASMLLDTRGGLDRIQIAPFHA
ncbi:MAG: beta strand repeat-containing protein, partial [Pirellulaceae bacterium]